MHILPCVLAALAVTSASVLPRQNTPDWISIPFNPPAIPLAVRSPYVSAWLPGGNNGGRLNGRWPTFWTGSTLGWAGYVRVDGKVYTFLGAPAVPGSTLAAQKRMEFTGTKSSFVLGAGPIDLNVTFLSPVEPTDYVRQSMPLSYMLLSIKSTDGKPHTVQYYTDISAEWVSGDGSLPAKWSTTKITQNGGSILHEISLQNPVAYKELNDHVQYGSAYYGTNQANGLTYATGEDAIVRAMFIKSGALDNSQDTGYRAINDRWPVFAFARDVGSVTDSTASPVVFAVGHVRDPLVRSIAAGNKVQDRYPYWRTKYANANEMISAFLSTSEYDHAVSAAWAIDKKIRNDATPISPDYTAITHLSLRQAFATIELTVSKSPNGQYDTSDVKAFMKEISSNGNVNTVDVIFPTWPMFLYLNPDLGRSLLEPLFEYQRSGLYPNKWCIHDLGSSYPKATGHGDGKDEAMPIEESGNMLIMALSYTRATKDTSMLSNNYQLLKQWTQFLVNNSLIPAEQLSTDDFAGHLANQTNLAIKGIIGIRAMSEIADLLGHKDDAKQYLDIATSYVSAWQTLAMSNEGHLVLNYNHPSSWVLSYNLYADKLLQFNLFPQAIYEMQSGWYDDYGAEFGVPLDSRHAYTKSDWEMFTAATALPNTRVMLVSRLRDYLANGKNDMPLSDWYDTIWGKAVGFRARPVVGGHFALLALTKPQESSVVSDHSAAWLTESEGLSGSEQAPVTA